LFSLELFQRAISRNLTCKNLGKNQQLKKTPFYLELIEEEWVARVGCIVNLVDGTIILKKSLSQQ
jgi:hypothetical protein